MLVQRRRVQRLTGRRREVAIAMPVMMPPYALRYSLANGRVRSVAPGSRLWPPGVTAPAADSECSPQSRRTDMPLSVRALADERSTLSYHAAGPGSSARRRLHRERTLE